MTTIKIYGDYAKDIEQGELFYATVESVEGRKVVKLTKLPIKLNMSVEKAT